MSSLVSLFFSVSGATLCVWSIAYGHHTLVDLSVVPSAVGLVSAIFACVDIRRNRQANFGYSLTILSIALSIVPVVLFMLLKISLWNRSHFEAKKEHAQCQTRQILRSEDIVYSTL